jgi:RNA polymerase sigma factor (TIGR02999 family)
VHEAYLWLVDNHASRHWNSRGHLFSAAAEAMRRILVENARRKARVRHGGAYRRMELHNLLQDVRPEPETILAVDDVVTRLAVDDPASADLVKLHIFAGLTLEESADALGVSRATAYRLWSYARAYLRLVLRDDSAQTPA